MNAWIFVLLVCLCVAVGLAAAGAHDLKQVSETPAILIQPRQSGLISEAEERPVDARGHQTIPHDSVYVDSFIRATMDTAHIPGVAAWASKRGQVVWEGYYGYARLSDSMPVTDSTIFLVMSISKTVTATAVMQLWERGVFGLDDSINAYLPFSVRNPYYPDSAITFRMLLTHTSSIRENWTITDPLWVNGDSPIPLGYFLENYLVPGGIYFSNQSFWSWPPGLAYNYSNVGVGLLAYLVEVLEDSFPVHCQDSIFAPLSMHETSWFLANLDTNIVATGYHWTGLVYDPQPHWGFPYYPAGQLRTNLTDLAQHLLATMQHGVLDTVRILDSATVDSMLIPRIEWTAGRWVCLLWGCYDTGARWIWGHDGGGVGAGVNAVYAFCPEESSAVVVLTNGESFWNGTYLMMCELFDYAVELGIEEEDIEFGRPASESRLLGSRPNPFTGRTAIDYQLSAPGHVGLRVYDSSGKLVKVLVDAEQEPGHYGVTWDGKDELQHELPSGVYFCRFTARTTSSSRDEISTATRKMVVLR